jgi:glutamate-1-semialdehyde 2,1-aminomutase
VIAGAVNSNVRLSGTPLCFASASGSRLLDLDDNEYIDYALGMGPTILGHAPKGLVDGVTACLSAGQLFAGQHASELELASLLQRYIPSAELVRIGMTGSEMVQAALRVARAFTGKPGFIKFEGQYHGWFDNVLVNHSGPAGDPSGPLPFPVQLQTAGQSRAATADTHVLPWNDIEAVRRYLTQHGSEIAALITEPVMCNTGVIPPRPGYLTALRELCDQHHVVLIFDEVITGFRLGLGGAQGKFGVRPDLSTFAKAFGGGFPVAALAGRRDIMSLFASGEVNHSGTYNANLVSIVAGIETIKQLAADDAAVYGRVEAMGEKLIVGIREIATRRSTNLRVTGYGSVFHTAFADESDIVDFASHRRADAKRQRAFVNALLFKGIRPTNRATWFLSAAHTDLDIEQTLSAVDAVLADGLED